MSDVVAVLLIVNAALCVGLFLIIHFKWPEHWS